MFDIHQSITNDDGDRNEELLENYQEGLIREFTQSPEGVAHFEAHGRFGYADMFLRYYFDYVDDSVPAMTLRDIKEVLFDLFPQKVSTEATNGPGIVAEVRAFWSFLGRHYGLPQAPLIVEFLNDKAGKRLQDALADPRNYGMAKSFVMAGIKAGYDMTSPEGMEQFQAVYNAQLAGGARDVLSLSALNNPFGEFDPDSGLPPLPYFPTTRTSTKDDRKRKKQQRQAKKRNRR